jgi:hypothetical protein
MTLSLLSLNVGSRRLVDSDLLVYGICLAEECPEALKEASRERIPLGVCLEEHHMNVVGFKIATILKVAHPKSLAVLTVDGSPHCVQLHFAAEQARRLTDAKTELSHFVVEKGVLTQISSETIRLARHLSAIQKRLEGRTGA